MIDGIVEALPSRKIDSETCKKFNYQTGTYKGKPVHIANYYDKNFSVRSFQERAAINAPIQGSAADIIRLAMIKIDKILEENNKAKMLLQIHDELIFETPKEEVKRISKIIIEEMTSVTKSDQHSFSIPLTVDLNTGDNWGALH